MTSGIGVAAAGTVETTQFVVGENLLFDLARIVGLTAVAVVIGCSIGILHRWYADDLVPEGLSVLVGVSAVAVYLNTAGALGEVVGGYDDLLAVEAAVFNVVTFAVAAAGAAAGGRVGDRVGVSLFAATGRKAVDADVSRLVRTVGRVTTVKVPEEIDDIDGYDPVDAATKEKLSGQTLLFPRRLTVEELRTRFVDRLQNDYGVGHVDVDLAADATVEYLAVGGRESGIGPTLPPGSAALAVKADPANTASPGDAVQLWTAGDPEAGTEPQRIANGELRGTAGDVATLAMDEADARQLDTESRYRLVTLPVEPRADREFASQLRAAAETMGVFEVAEESALASATVGALAVAVVAIRSPSGAIEATPQRTRTIEPGETVYAIARPDRLRRLEAGATVGGEASSEAADD